MPTTRDVRAFSRLLGARIVELRHARNLTQEKCAGEAGLSKAYLSQIEAGKRLPSLPMLLSLSTHLGLDLRDLMPRWRSAEGVVQLGHEEGAPYGTPEVAAHLEHAKNLRRAVSSARSGSDDARTQRARRTR